MVFTSGFFTYSTPSSLGSSGSSAIVYVLHGLHQRVLHVLDSIFPRVLWVLRHRLRPPWSSPAGSSRTRLHLPSGPLGPPRAPPRPARARNRPPRRRRAPRRSSTSTTR